MKDKNRRVFEIVPIERIVPSYEVRTYEVDENGERVGSIVGIQFPTRDHAADYVHHMVDVVMLEDD